MKKITAILLASLMTLALTACAGGKENTENIGNAEVAQNNKEESQTPGATPDDAASEQGERKILVAYFSATNNTEGVAQKLAPDAVMGEPLSVHYSGDDSLSDNIAAWLGKRNEMKGRKQI